MTRVQREAQLLDIAEEIFIANGYQVSTMDDIADQAGITKPVIYDHFGSKEGLLAACIARCRRTLRDATEAVWAHGDGTVSTEQRLRTGLLAFFTMIDEQDQRLALIQQEGALGVDAQPSRESIQAEQARIVAQSLAHDPALAHTPFEVLEGYAMVLIGTCERVAMWRLQRPHLSAQTATDIVMTVVWGGLSNLVAEPVRS